MPVIVKFIVSNEENAQMISHLAKAHFRKVVKDIDIDKEYSVHGFLTKANAFTREWLMSFDVTGDDEEREEKPLAFIEMVSAHLPEEITGNKPLFIEKIIPSGEENGTAKVMERVVEIAKQRRHDAIWISVPPADSAMIATVEKAGFTETGKYRSMLLFKRENV